MTYDEAVQITNRLRERGNASFSPSEKSDIERLYPLVLGKKFRVTSCQRCYHDAVIEIALYLRSHDTMPEIKEKLYELRHGFIIHCPEFHGGKVFSNANITDEIAAEYWERYPNMRKFFDKVPEKPVLSASNGAKDDGVGNVPQAEKKPRKTKKAKK